MSYGVLIKSSDGSVLLDEAYINYSLTNKLDFATYNGSLTAVTSMTDRAPILAIHCEGKAGIVGCVFNGGYRTWYIAGSIAGQCTAYVFDRIVSTKTDTHGLHIYDVNGILRVSSAEGYLGVVDIFETASYYQNNPVVNRTYAPGKYAVILGTPRVNAHTSPYYADGITCTTSTIKIEMGVYVNTNSLPGYAWVSKAGNSVSQRTTYSNAMVIDVSGY